MTILYPPVLQSRGKSIPAYVDGMATVDLYFSLPLSITRNDIKHIQVVLKYYDNGLSATNPLYSPDESTLFLDASQDSFNFHKVDNTDLYILRINYECFKSGGPLEQKDYLIQVRFGSSVLWAGGGPPATGFTPGMTPSNGWAVDDGVYTFTNFATWRKGEVNKNPSGFGEWSNLQRIHCYSSMMLQLNVDYSDFTPIVGCVFSPTDPTQTVEQISFTYSYRSILTKLNDAPMITETLVASGVYNNDNIFTAQVRLPIAPVTTVYCNVRLVTKNNTILENSIIIPAMSSAGVYDLTQIQELENVQLTGQRIDDGVIAKRFNPTILTNIKSYSIYRINLLDFTTIKLYNNLEYFDSKWQFYDYTVEMGQRYIYFILGANEDKTIHYALTPITPWGEGNKSYGRLLKMEYGLLTTRQHQLRLAGNFTVSSFKRNTTDSFQETINGKYPFYSRVAKKNYRTLQISAAVSINLDPTFTFLQFEQDKGLYWIDDDCSELLIFDTDLFNTKDISLSRRRVKDLKSQTESIISLDNNMRDVPYGPDSALTGMMGPQSLYDRHLYRQEFVSFSTNADDITIFAERKFREQVMKWLSDGKPKLFRSENEGNMIVMVSQPSFTPLSSSNRRVYTVSCTLTEIADYNIENLIKYNLVPIEFKAYYTEDIGFKFKAGEVDPNISPHLVYKNVNNQFKIPVSCVGKLINAFNTYPAVELGSGDYSFSSPNLPNGLNIDSQSGIVYGTINDLVGESDIILNVHDNRTGLNASMIVPFAGSYEPLTLTSSTAIEIEELIVGHPITIQNLSGLVSSGYGTKKFYGPGLPFGITITDDGTVLSGKYLYPTGEGNTVIYVNDEDGNVVGINVHYNGSKPKLVFNKLTSFRIGISEVNVPIDEIDFNIPGAVEGGATPYTFSLVNPQPGMSITADGKFNWTPTAVISVGVVTIKVTDNVGDDASITVVFDATVDEFKFDNSLIPIIEIPDMAVGDVLTSFSLLDGVLGGLPYPQEDGPKYRFKSAGLLPDFTIDDYGVITGQAKEVSAARTATITISDYRGKSITYDLPIGEITAT